MSTVESSCQLMWDLLKRKAPNFRPKIIGRGFDDDQLNALSTSKSQGSQIESSLESYLSKHTKNYCTVCHEPLDDETGGALISVWEYDFVTFKQRLSGLHYACETCYSLSDLEEILPIISAPNADVSHYVQQFLKINGISIDSTPSVDQSSIVVECYSIAFSLKILLSNFPEWHLVDDENMPFNSKTNFSRIFNSLMPHQQEAKTKTGKSTVDASNNLSAPTGHQFVRQANYKSKESPMTKLSNQGNDRPLKRPKKHEE